MCQRLIQSIFCIFQQLGFICDDENLAYFDFGFGFDRKPGNISQKLMFQSEIIRYWKCYYIVNNFIMQPRRLCFSAAGRIKCQELLTGNLKGWLCLTNITSDGSNLVQDCSQAVLSKGYPRLAIQYGGQCFSSTTAKDTSNQYGTSTNCLGDAKGRSMPIMFTKLKRAINCFAMDGYETKLFIENKVV